MCIGELAEGLELEKIKDRPWQIRGICTLTEEGISEGLNWLSQELQSKK